MALKPVAGRDYPQTYREFVEKFPDKDSCEKFLEILRWPDGFVCPGCAKKTAPWRQSRGRLVCCLCHHQTTVGAGTIFDKTRTPLTTWFEAAWHLTTAKNGLSAKTLERTLGVSYRTAWTMLQRFRVAMVRTERERLSGNIEVDEVFVGGVIRNGKRGRGSERPIVAIAVEVLRPKGFGRVRIQHIPDASGKSLELFIEHAAARGATILTDGWRGYNGLVAKGFAHKKTVVTSSGDPAHVSMPAVSRVAALLKRWILGTHQGSFQQEHLQAYAEEFTFRFNRRKSSSRGLVFHRLLEQAVYTAPVTEFDVKGGYNWKQD